MLTQTWFATTKVLSALYEPLRMQTTPTLTTDSWHIYLNNLPKKGPVIFSCNVSHVSSLRTYYLKVG